MPDDTDNETADDNQTVTDEISLRPIGKSAVDEYGGYWDYDLSNATFDAINDLREEKRFATSDLLLKVQEWADTRSREIWIVDERDGIFLIQDRMARCSHPLVMDAMLKMHS